MTVSLSSGKGSLNVFPTITHTFYSSPASSWRFGMPPPANLSRLSKVIACGVSGKERATGVRTPQPSTPAKTSISLVWPTHLQGWMNWRSSVYLLWSRQTAPSLLSKHSLPCPLPSAQALGSNSLHLAFCFRTTLSLCYLELSLWVTAPRVHSLFQMR